MFDFREEIQMSDKRYNNIRSERRIRNNKVKRQHEMRKNILLIILTFCFIITVSLSMNSFLSNAKNENSQASYKYYKSITIENGDTLWSIAQEYMDDSHYGSINEYINEVKQMNTLYNDDITYGQHLIIPYYGNDYIG